MLTEENISYWLVSYSDLYFSQFVDYLTDSKLDRIHGVDFCAFLNMLFKMGINMNNINAENFCEKVIIRENYPDYLVPCVYCSQEPCIFQTSTKRCGNKDILLLDNIPRMTLNQLDEYMGT